MLAIILVYLFSVIGYLFFKSDFIMEYNKPESETPSTDDTCPSFDIRDCNKKSLSLDGEDDESRTAIFLTVGLIFEFFYV